LKIKKIQQYCEFKICLLNNGHILVIDTENNDLTISYDKWESIDDYLAWDFGWEHMKPNLYKRMINLTEEK